MRLKRVTVLFFAGILLIPNARFVLAAEARCHTASAQEIELLKARGINITNGQVCDNDQTQLTGGCAEDPIPFLLSHYTPGPASSVEGQNGIKGLNSDFACRLSKFIKTYPGIVIVSAFRSNETQAGLFDAAVKKYGSESAARVHVAPPGKSRHNSGLAADLGNIPDNSRGQERQYGLYYRMGYEPWHIEPSGDVAGGSAVGDGTGMDAAKTPTSGFSDMLRQYMGGGQQPATGAVPANNSMPASSQPYGSTQSGTIAQPSTSGSTGSTGAVTAGGTSQTTAVPATIATGNTAQPTNVSDQLTTTQPTGSSNAHDLLNALANPTTTKTTSTSTPIALNGSLYQSQQLTQTQQVQYDANGQPIALNGSLSNVSALGPNGQQTFTSQDLQYTQSNSYVAPTNTSFAQRTLENLKQALLKLLSILKPFGYVRPQIAPEDATE
jgi:hypothetical protein